MRIIEGSRFAVSPSHSVDAAFRAVLACGDTFSDKVRRGLHQNRRGGFLDGSVAVRGRCVLVVEVDAHAFRHLARDVVNSEDLSGGGFRCGVI